jgi:hypothetical protein
MIAVEQSLKGAKPIKENAQHDESDSNPQKTVPHPFRHLPISDSKKV